MVSLPCFPNLIICVVPCSFFRSLNAVYKCDCYTQRVKTFIIKLSVALVHSTKLHTKTTPSSLCFAAAAAATTLATVFASARHKNQIQLSCIYWYLNNVQHPYHTAAFPCTWLITEACLIYLEHSLIYLIVFLSFLYLKPSAYNWRGEYLPEQ